MIRSAWLKSLRGMRPSDLIFRAVTLLMVFVVIAIVVGVAWILVVDSMPTIQQAGFSFLTRQDFDPVHDIYGVLRLFMGHWSRLLLL